MLLTRLTHRHRDSRLTSDHRRTATAGTPSTRSNYPRATRCNSPLRSPLAPGDRQSIRSAIRFPRNLHYTLHHRLSLSVHGPRTGSTFIDHDEPNATKSKLTFRSSTLTNRPFEILGKLSLPLSLSRERGRENGSTFTARLSERIS